MSMMKTIQRTAIRDLPCRLFHSSTSHSRSEFLKSSATCKPQPYRLQQQRKFVSAPWETDLQRIHAVRTLPYPSAALYDVIADIQSYADFVPFCQASTVTRWSEADKNGRKWPRKAKLRVGWSGFEEELVSRVFCVPGKVVEAVSGDARTTLSEADLLQLYGNVGPEDDPSPASALFRHLLTTWTFRSFPYKPPPDGAHPTEGQPAHPPQERTEVNLAIEFQFVNPVYSALSKAATPKIANMMIEAFEARAKEVLDEKA